MPTITVTTTTWKANRGRQVIRIIRLEGEYSGRCFPTIIFRLAGRTGCRLFAPVERQEVGGSDWQSAKSALYHSLDREWTIVAESSLEAKDEPALLKALGSRRMKLIGPDPYEFLASWFPVQVSKEISRTRDGLETRRVVHVVNRNCTAVTISATKRAGYPERLDAKWGGPPPASMFGMFGGSLAGDGHMRLGQETRTSCPDEVTLRACLGPALLGWMSRSDYARLVRTGDNSGAVPSEVWGDGYDHGGIGLPPPPRADSADAFSPSIAAPDPQVSTGVPRLSPMTAPAEASPVKVIDDTAYRDDPSYGSF